MTIQHAQALQSLAKQSPLSKVRIGKLGRITSAVAPQSSPKWSGVPQVPWLQPGTLVGVNEQYGDWYKIMLGQHTVAGWVPTSYVRFESQTVSQSPEGPQATSTFNPSQHVQSQQGAHGPSFRSPAIDQNPPLPPPSPAEASPNAPSSRSFVPGCYEITGSSVHLRDQNNINSVKGNLNYPDQVYVDGYTKNFYVQPSGQGPYELHTFARVMVTTGPYRDSSGFVAIEYLRSCALQQQSPQAPQNLTVAQAERVARMGTVTQTTEAGGRAPSGGGGGGSYQWGGLHGFPNHLFDRGLGAGGGGQSQQLGPHTAPIRMSIDNGQLSVAQGSSWIPATLISVTAWGGDIDWLSIVKNNPDIRNGNFLFDGQGSIQGQSIDAIGHIRAGQHTNLGKFRIQAQLNISSSQVVAQATSARHMMSLRGSPSGFGPAISASAFTTAAAQALNDYLVTNSCAGCSDMTSPLRQLTFAFKAAVYTDPATMNAVALNMNTLLAQTAYGPGTDAALKMVLGGAGVVPYANGPCTDDAGNCLGNLATPITPPAIQAIERQLANQIVAVMKQVPYIPQPELVNGLVQGFAALLNQFSFEFAKLQGQGQQNQPPVVIVPPPVVTPVKYDLPSPYPTDSKLPTVPAAGWTTGEKVVAGVAAGAAVVGVGFLIYHVGKKG